MHLRLFGIFAAISAVLVATPSFAACQLRYATRLAEAALTAQATIRAEALRNVAAQLENGLGDRPSANVALAARYSMTAAGGLALEAYSETVEGFLCTLQERMADRPDQVERLRREYRAIVLTLDRFFDPGRWQLDAIAARDALRLELENAPVEAPRFAAAEIDAGLPNPNFDTVQLRQITVNVTIPSVIEGSICGGLVRRSVRRVEPQILASLGNIRPMLTKWLSGDRASARLDLWLFASAQMTRQLTRASVTPEQIPVTPEFLACVEQARDIAATEQQATQPPAQAPAVAATPAPNGANAPPSQ